MTCARAVKLANRAQLSSLIARKMSTLFEKYEILRGTIVYREPVKRCSGGKLFFDALFGGRIKDGR